MLSWPPTVRIFLCAAATDMRKGFDSLAALVESSLALDPMTGHLFVFRSRRGDRLKVLWWDRDGYCLWYKKQEPDCPHPPAFTGIGRRSHNRAGRPSSAGGMDRSPTPSDPRRWPMSRGAAVVAPPRARPSFGPRRSTNSGIG